MVAREVAVDELLMDGIAKLDDEIVETLDEPRIPRQLTEKLVLLFDPVRFGEGDNRRLERTACFVTAERRRGGRLSLTSLLVPRGVRLVGQDRRRVLGVRLVDEETRAAREVERVGTAGVVGCDHGRDSRSGERRLGELRVG